MAAVVKGSMMYRGEDDTSSDEDVRPERHEEAPVLPEDSEEEELEVFTTDTALPPLPPPPSLSSSSAQPSAAPSTSGAPAKSGGAGGSRRLIDLMAASVAKHEGETPPPPPSAVPQRQGVTFNAGFESSDTSTATNINRSGTTTTKVAVDAVDESEAFGIAYKPYAKRGADGDSASFYSVPGKGGDEEDEDLRLLDVPKPKGGGKKDPAAALSRSAAANGDEGDDEFDDFDVSGPSSPSSVKIEMAALAAKAKAAREQEDEAAAVLASLALEIQQAPQDEEGEGEGEGEGEVKEGRGESSGPDNQAAAGAEEGYQAVSGIYALGAAGDTDVQSELAAVSSSSSSDVTTQPQQQRQLPVVVPSRNHADIKMAILEEEEEEEEEEEDEEGDGMSKQPVSSSGHQKEEKKETVALQAAVDAFDASMPSVPAGASLQQGISQKGTKFVAATYSDTVAYAQGLSSSLRRHEEKIRPFEPRSSKDSGKSLMTLMGLKTDNRRVEVLAVKEEGRTTQDLLRWPFLLAQEDYDPSEPRQLLILQTIYRALVGKHGTHERDVELPPHVPATGSHWDAIGFQGSDPCTDVNRSMKLFALLQALHYVLKFGIEAKAAHRLSVLVPGHKDNAVGTDLSWPFMCVSISFTKEAIVAMRTGELNGACNERNSVLETLHAYHRACFYKFAALLSSDPHTHHAIHLSTIRAASADKPYKFLRAYLDKPKVLPSAARQQMQADLGFASSSSSSLSGEESDATLEFVDMDKQPAETSGVDEEAAARYLAGNAKANKFLA
jgi:hypothetical protein